MCSWQPARRGIKGTGQQQQQQWWWQLCAHWLQEALLAGWLGGE
jgi:hypothetical protein